MGGEEEEDDREGKLRGCFGSVVRPQDARAEKRAAGSGHTCRVLIGHNGTRGRAVFHEVILRSRTRKKDRVLECLQRACMRDVKRDRCNYQIRRMCALRDVEHGGCLGCSPLGEDSSAFQQASLTSYTGKCCSYRGLSNIVIMFPLALDVRRATLRYPRRPPRTEPPSGG